MEFKKLEAIKANEIMPGFKGKFVHGDNLTLAYWEIDAGSVLPEHSHFHEQTSSILEGRFEMTIEGKTQILEPGVVAVIPSNARHSGKAITDCRIIDTFSPQREEYQNPN